MKFLLTLWPFETHLHPNLALAHALREAGHEVAFYTGDRARNTLAAENFRHFPFREVDQGHFERVMDSILAGRARPWRLRKIWSEFLVGSVPAQIQDLRQVLEHWPPDVIVCDMAMWGPIVVLGETTGIPIAVFSHVGYCMLPGPDGPLPGISLPRSRNLGIRAGAWFVSRAVRLMTAIVAKDADKVRSAFGLRPLGMRITEYFGKLPLYLIPSTPEFDYERPDLPSSVHYLGPCLWPPLPSFEETRGHAQVQVVVHEGTFYTPKPSLLRAAVQGLARLPFDVRIFAGKGRDLSHLELAPAADNIHLHEWRPLSEVIRCCDLLVTNGNTELALGALTCAVPLVVVPSTLDQSEMAWRVQESGAGIRLSERRCTPERLRQAVQSILDDRSYLDQARRLAGCFTQYGGVERAVALLTGVAKRGNKHNCERPCSN